MTDSESPGPEDPLAAEEEAGSPLPESEEPDVPLPEDLPAELVEDSEESGDPTRQANLHRYLQGLNPAEKIKLATFGSRAARRLLLRDANKLVNVAVIRSPKIREDEVLAAVQDRSVSEEVVRVVLGRKEWLKAYPIRLALCHNPKTPIPRALRLLETLQEKDLRQLSKSRNVPGVVSSGALRVLARRGKV